MNRRFVLIYPQHQEFQTRLAGYPRLLSQKNIFQKDDLEYKIN